MIDIEHDIEISKDAYVRVIWYDDPENYTKEKHNRIKSHFYNKYGVKNINIIFRSSERKDIEDTVDADFSDNILDEQYQRKLFNQWLIINNIKVDMEHLLSLDTRVNETFRQQREQEARYRKWFIKKIEFDNFLSFGEGNIINYESLNGITVVSSEPSNFGGKTNLSVDLPLFLFFNQTTKSSKSIDIFNKYTKKDRVRVKGYITIDTEDYIVERIITRKKKSRGEGYSTKTDLFFYKVMPSGDIINLEGEQRRETDDLIKKTIGNYDDFLTTIITTSDNIEGLIDTKPTERGKLLSKFIGIEAIENKEKIAKEMYSNWSRTLKSNIHNISDINKTIEDTLKDIKQWENDIISEEKRIKDLKKKRKNSELKKDSLIAQKTDIDDDIAKADLESLKEEIDGLEKKIKKSTKKYEDSKVELATILDIDYDEDEYKDVREEEKTISIRLAEIELHKEKLEEMIYELKNGELCPTCKRAFDDIDNSDHIEVKESDFTDLLAEQLTCDSVLESVQKTMTDLEDKKVLYDSKEKLELINAKNEVEVEKLSLDLSKKQKIVADYHKNLIKIEENKKLESLILGYKSKIENLNIERDKLIRDVEGKRNDVENGKNLIIESNNIIKTIETEQKIDKIFKIYLNLVGKNGIGKLVMKNVLPTINAELERLLSDTADFSLELSINDKNEVEFLMIDQQTKIEKNLFTGSGFEKTVGSLALRAVLSRVSTLPKPNIIVFDEVLGKISNDNLDKIALFFDKIKEYFQIILLITHNPVVKDWGDNIITIKKQKNVSQIVTT
tara:strand:+ start:1408 stop:3768 length:2361 start_codon:yes stop_codon:yes gene_type:complete